MRRRSNAIRMRSHPLPSHVVDTNVSRDTCVSHLRVTLARVTVQGIRCKIRLPQRPQQLLASQPNAVRHAPLLLSQNLRHVPRITLCACFAAGRMKLARATRSVCLYAGVIASPATPRCVGGCESGVCVRRDECRHVMVDVSRGFCV